MIVVKKIRTLLIEKRHNYMQAFEEDKARFSVRLEKNPAFASLKKYVISYAILQIFPQVNILKECQLKGKALPRCTNLFKRSIGLPCAYSFEQKALKNRSLLVTDCFIELGLVTILTSTIRYGKISKRHTAETRFSVR